MTLTLKTAKQFFCMTLHLMIIHHHTKFSYERLSGSGDIVQTKSGQRDRWRDGHMDTVIPIYTPSPSQIHYKGIKKKRKKERPCDYAYFARDSTGSDEAIQHTHKKKTYRGINMGLLLKLQCCSWFNSKVF